ncbi:MAG: hypothetical protein ACJAR9_001129 [Celeribacter sp.]|jgi:hypothetical protein
MLKCALKPLRRKAYEQTGMLKCAPMPLRRKAHVYELIRSATFCEIEKGGPKAYPFFMQQT